LKLIWQLARNFKFIQLQNYKTGKIHILLLHFEIVRILVVFVVNY